MIKFKYTDCSNDYDLFEIIFGLKKSLLFISHRGKEMVRLITIFFFFFTLSKIQRPIQIAINKIYIDLRND